MNCRRLAEQKEFFEWKTYGILCEDYLRQLDCWKEVSRQDGGFQRSIDISVLEKWVVQHPKFLPLKTEVRTDGQFEQVPDLDYAINYPVPIPPEGSDEMYGMLATPFYETTALVY